MEIALLGRFTPGVGLRRHPSSAQERSAKADHWPAASKGDFNHRLNMAFCYPPGLLS